LRGLQEDVQRILRFEAAFDEDSPGSGRKFEARRAFDRANIGQHRQKNGGENKKVNFLKQSFVNSYFARKSHETFQ